MAETISIYSSNLYPNFPSSPLIISSRFSNLRHRLNSNYSVIPNVQSPVPPTYSNFQMAWDRYIFPDKDRSILINKPYHFSELQDVLRNFDFNFEFEQSRPGNVPSRVYRSITDVEVRYCIALAAFNIVFYLKNMILCRTNMFGKIDFIMPCRLNHSNSNILLEQISEDGSSPQNVLYVDTEIYRELDYYIRASQSEEFCSRIIYIVDRVTPEMLSISHNQTPNLRQFFSRILDSEIRHDHGELKAIIISKLQEKDIPESIIGALYDLIIEYQMQTPNF